MSSRILEEMVLAQKNLSEALLTERQAGGVLKLSNRTLQAWRVRGCGPKFVKVGRSVRYRLMDVQAFVDKNVCQSTSEK